MAARSLPSAVVRQLAPRAWCPLQCLLAKTVGVLSPGVGRSEECAQEFAPQSHIHSGLKSLKLVEKTAVRVAAEKLLSQGWWSPLVSVSSQPGAAPEVDSRRGLVDDIAQRLEGLGIGGAGSRSTSQILLVEPLNIGLMVQPIR